MTQSPEDNSIDADLERVKQPEIWVSHKAAYNLSRATERFDEIGRAFMEAFEVSGDDDIARRMAAMGAKIRAIGPDLARLILSGENYKVTYRAIMILESMAPHAPADTGLAAWPLIDHDSARIRAGAAIALGACGATVCDAVPEAAQKLGALLEDSEPTVRLKAAWALGQLGAQAACALPLLQESKRDLHVEIVAAAEEAIWRIRGDQAGTGS